MLYEKDSQPFLGGQRTPRASDGVGVQILYRCSGCQRIWFQNGKHVTLELEEATIQILALALHADLLSLPAATCRLCLARIGNGATEIDEYGRGEGGYGISWEFPGPPVVHAMLSLLSTHWMARQAGMAATLPGTVTRPGHMRAVLSWFLEQYPPDDRQVQLLQHEETAMIQQSNRAEFGQEGTRDWVWKGSSTLVACPPLKGKAALQLVMAMPASSPFSSREQFVLCQNLVRLTLTGSVPGEEHS